MSDYLLNLNFRLTEALAKLPETFRQRHAHYLAHRQNGDGGFSGREGGSDLYYTGFALRGLAVLDMLSPEVSGRASAFLAASLAGHADVVDFFSLLYSCLLVLGSGGPDVLANSPTDWPERVAATLESFRAKDGGYAKTPGGNSGSTYHTFLVALCYQLLSKAIPGRGAVLEFVRSRRRDDGGFVEIAPMRRSGTNPTAAAVALLRILQGDEFDRQEVEPALAFLASMPGMEGGLRANASIPLSDLLSTFTGAWTLAQHGALDRIGIAQAREFVHALELPNGGFKGGIWDEETDVEYTFYGLGALALLSS